jgi:hypothetical protein
MKALKCNEAPVGCVLHQLKDTKESAHKMDESLRKVETSAVTFEANIPHAPSPRTVRNVKPAAPLRNGGR